MIKPSTLNKEQILKVIKVAAYVALSGAISALIAKATDSQEAFGIYWPIVNIVLVFIKQVFTPKQ